MHYDSWAADYDEDTRRFGWCAPQRVVEAITARVSVGPALRVLDLGVGTGQCSAPFLAAGSTVVGVDASASMLEQAATRGPFARLVALTLGERSLTDALRGQKPFDVVLACGVLHFVADLAELLHEVRALAGPGAVVSLTTIPPQSRSFGATTRLHRPDVVASWLNAARFRVVAQEAFVAYRDQGNPDDPVTYTLSVAEA